MSRTLQQIFTDNPITTNQGADLMYFARSPYSPGNDAGMLFSDFSAQFGSSVTPSALTKTDDTNVTLILGGTPLSALLQDVSLTLGWTGTLSPTRGGLGISITPTNGQIPIGNGTNYTAATLTAGTGVSITNGSGSITIDAMGMGSFMWNDVSGTSQAAAVNQGYIISNASQTTVTLPATAAEGSVFGIAGKGAAGWILQMNTGQTCHLGNTPTTSGGTLTSTNQYDSVQIVCVTANTTFIVIASQGTLTTA